MMTSLHRFEILGDIHVIYHNFYFHLVIYFCFTEPSVITPAKNCEFHTDTKRNYFKQKFQFQFTSCWLIKRIKSVQNKTET